MMQMKTSFRAWKRIAERILTHWISICFYDFPGNGIIVEKSTFSLTMETWNKRIRAQICVTEASLPGPNTMLKKNSSD